MNKTRKIFALGIGLVPTSIVPLAVVISCGESSGETTAPKTELVAADTAKISDLKFSATSTHNQVTWIVPNYGATIAKAQYYLAANAMTVQEVQALGATVFSDALPSAVNFDATKRALFVKLFPAEGYKLEATIFDVTNTSGIQNIPSLVDAIANYSSIDLNAITLNVLDTNYAVEEGFIVPQGAQLAFDFGDKHQLTVEALKTELAAAKPTKIDLENNLFVYIVPQSNSYIVRDDRRAHPKVEFPIVRDRLASADLAKLTAIKPTAESTNESVSWETPANGFANTEIKEIGFLVTDLSTLDEVSKQPSTAWSTKLPKTVAYDYTKRHLWARVSPQPGYYFRESIVDLTTTSKIDTIKSLITGAAWYPDLSSFAYSAAYDVAHDSLVVNTPTLASEAKIIYQIGLDGVYGSFLETKDALVAGLRDQIESTAAVTVRATLQLASSELLAHYILPVKTWTFAFGITNGYVNLHSLPADEAKLKALKIEANSTHNALVWSAAPTLSSDIKAVLYLSGNYPTVESAKAAAPTLWTTTLPTNVVYDYAQRYVWARIEVEGTKGIRNPYLDITATSGVQDVKSLVDTSSSYKIYEQKPVFLSGTETTPAIDDSATTVFTGVKLVYSFLGETNLTKEQVIQKIKDRSAVITNEEISALKIGLAPVSERYVVNDSKAWAVLSDGNGDSAKAFTIVQNNTVIDISEQITSIFVANKSANNTKVGWAAYTLPENVASVKFISGNYPTRADAVANFASATTTLPTAVPYYFTSRFLWVYATPKTGYIFKGGNSYYNATAKSLLQQRTILGEQYVPTIVPALATTAPEYATIDLSKIKITGTIGSLTVDYSNIKLFEGVSIVYQYNGTPHFYLSSEEITARLNSDISLQQTTPSKNILDQLRVIKFWIAEQNYDAFASLPYNTKIASPDITEVILPQS